jgi:hypothetical protein
LRGRIDEEGCMTGKDILNQINERKEDDHKFISWWRKEEDWLDFDLVDRFIKNVDPVEEIGGFDLHTMEEMWQNLEAVAPDRVQRDTQRGEEIIVWKRTSGEEQTCPFIPSSVMTIFDVETHGDNVD